MSTENNLSTTDLVSLIETITDLVSSPELEKVLDLTAQKFSALLGLEACLIYTWDAQWEVAELWASYQPNQWDTGPLWGESFRLEGAPRTRALLISGFIAQGRIDDPNLDPGDRKLLEQSGLKSYFMIPLVLEDTIGFIALLDSRQIRTFTDFEIDIGRLITRHIAMAVERANLLQDTQQRALELEALFQASLSLTASLDLREVLDAILRSTMDLMTGSEDAHIFLLEGGKLKFGSARWANGEKGAAYAEPRQDGLTYNVARKGEMILVQDIRDHPLFETAPPDWKGSIVGIPLKIGERVLGVMNIANERPHAFSEAELRTLRLLGDQAALAIENARLHNLVIEQAQTDTITGIFNRRALDARLIEEVQRSKRYQRPFSLIMMDLDNFKQVNDTYGHPVGDRVLQRIARCLVKVIRDTDFLARFGGDEFALVLPETDVEAGVLLGRRVQLALQNCSLNLPDARPMTLSASMGLATFPKHAKSATSLLVAADQALYLAKQENPGQLVCFSPKPQ